MSTDDCVFSRHRTTGVIPAYKHSPITGIVITFPIMIPYLRALALHGHFQNAVGPFNWETL